MECQVLLEYHDKLVTGLQNTITSLSAACYSQYLISEDTYRAVLELNLTNADKAMKVLLNVKETIEQKVDMFAEFVHVLDNFDCCTHLAEEIASKRDALVKGHLLYNYACMHACMHKLYFRLVHVACIAY